MLCCPNCFADPYLQEWIELHGTAVDDDEVCPHCGGDAPVEVSESGLAELFQPLINEYFVPFTELTQNRHEDPLNGEELGDLLQQEFGVFTDEVNDCNSLAAEIMSGCWGMDSDAVMTGYGSDELWFLREHDWIHRSLLDHWHVLEHGILEYGHGLVPGRFPPEDDFDELPVAYAEICSMLMAAGQALLADTTLFRSRRGNHDVSAMGAPPAHCASQGRGNVQGQPVLYLADSIDTVVAEVRPSIGDDITVGTFTTECMAEICYLVPEHVSI